MGIFDNVLSWGSGVLNTVSSSFSSALGNVQSTVSQSVQTAANNVQRTVQSTVSHVSRSAGQAFTTVNTTVNTAVNNLQQAAQQAGHDANRSIQQAQQAAQQAASQAAEKARQAQAVAQQAIANANAAEILKSIAAVNPIAAPVIQSGMIAQQAGAIAQSILNAASPAKSQVISPADVAVAAPQRASNDWYLTYSAVDQSGKQTSQTWADQTGRQTAFAGIDAAGLATYYAEKGNAAEAAKYQEIAKASSQNAVLQAQAGTKGTYYDIQPGIFGRSKDEITEIIKSQYPGRSEMASPATLAANANTANAAAATGGNLIDSIIGVRDGMYDSGGKNVAIGIKNGYPEYVIAGVGTSGAALAADVIAPLDLVNVANLWFTGRGDQITQDDLLWAGIDALAVVAGAVSFGAGYAGVKGIKTAAKVAKTTKRFAYGGQAVLGGTALAGALI